MINLRLAAVAGLSVSLAACATVAPVTNESRVIDIPPIGVITQRNVGETIIRKGVVVSVKTLSLPEPITVSGGITNGILNRLTAPSGVYRLVAQNQDKDFYSGHPIQQTGVVPMTWPTGSLCVAHDSSNVIGISSNVGACSGGGKIIGVGIGGATEQAGMGSQLKELLYDGKSGTTIRFSYREFAATDGGAIARPAFTQDLTYDLAEDKIIGFQSVRIEVEEATNSHIIYKVLSSFQ